MTPDELDQGLEVASALLEESDRVPAHIEPVRRVELAVHGALVAIWVDRVIPSGGAEAGRVGINGGQGTGKSTLTVIVHGALQRLGRRPASLALDDFYLTRPERRSLARRVHPLFVTRGVPGTHDVQLARKVMDHIAAGEAVRTPVFDKARDDRAPADAATRVEPGRDLILLEGWCVGCPPLSSASLDVPVNDLERLEDAEGRWRRHVAQALEGAYAQWFATLDRLVMLAAPGFDAVRTWRQDQENQLRRQRAGGMTARQVERFVSHYERLTQHMLATLPERTDLLLQLDPDHGIGAVRMR